MAIELVLRLGVFLEAPVRGDAELRGAVLLARADLDLVQLLPRPEDGGVQRLVAVGLGLPDIILDPLLHRRPALVDDT